MIKPASIPSSVLSDKERLADYILARSVERMGKIGNRESAEQGPSGNPESALIRRSPEGLVINLSRLRFQAVMPTAWTLSAGIHVLLLLILGVVFRHELLPAEPTAHWVTFDGSAGMPGDGQEAGGSGSAPELGPDLAGEPIKDEAPTTQLPPPPVPAPGKNDLPDPPSTAAETRHASVPSSTTAPDGQGNAAVSREGHGASGGTRGPGHGGEGGGGFGDRKGRGSSGLGRGGGTPASEAAVALGLKWLAAHQEASGAWDMGTYSKRCPGGDVCGGAPVQDGGIYEPGVTGLALLSFLGAGDTPLEGDYREVVEKAARWLEKCQQRDGLFGSRFQQGMMYNQGIATLALAELYGMTHDERAGAAAQRGVQFIERHQQDGGGWDYGTDRTGRDDTSVTGWQVMALKSAHAAGLKVSSTVLLKTMGHFVRNARPDGEVNYADKEPFAGRAGAGMGAVGLTSRVFLGWPRNSPAVEAGVKRCLAAAPGSELAMADDPCQGPYTWYYAALGLYQAGGGEWDRFNAVTRDYLVGKQDRRGHAAGSWASQDRISAVGGRVVCTSLNLLTLEVYYRYLPVYEKGRELAVADHMLHALPAPSQKVLLGLVAQEFDPGSARAFLHDVMNRPGSTPALKVEAASRLMDLGDASGAPSLADREDLTPAAAARLGAILLRSHSPKALPLLEKALSSEDPVSRFLAVKAMEEAGREGGKAAAPLLRMALQDPEAHIVARARKALALLGEPEDGVVAEIGEDVEEAGREPDPEDVPDALMPVPVPPRMALGDQLLALEGRSGNAGQLRQARDAWTSLRDEALQAVGKGQEPRRAVDLLNRFLFEEKGFKAFPPGEMRQGGSRLDEVIRKRCGNCVGLSSLYLALGEELGLPIQVVSLPTHCFLRLEGDGVATPRNIEPTDGGKEIEDADYPALLGESVPSRCLRSAGREALLAAVLTSRGADLGRQGKFLESLNDLDLALAYDPDSLPALSNRGHCLKQLGRRSEAERDYARALVLLPSWPAALLGQVDCLQETGRAKQAEALCEQAVRDRPEEVRFLLALGDCRRRAGRPQEAVALADRILARDASLTSALCLKGAALYQAGRIDEAEKVLKQATGLEPANASVRTELGRLYCGARRWDDAVTELQAALSSGGPGDGSAGDAKALLEYAKERRGGR